MLEILPPELIRFLIVRIKVNTQINFDPSAQDTISNLFDDYQRAASAYFNKTDQDLARILEMSQIGKVDKPPKVRFSVLAQWVQMPNMEDEIKKEGLERWAKYARVWVERFAPEDQKFTVQRELPEEAKTLTEKQKNFLMKASRFVVSVKDPTELQTKIYDLGKELNLSSNETFEAFYKSLIGKDHGPKLAWLLLSLDKKFVIKRLEEASK